MLIAIGVSMILVGLLLLALRLQDMRVYKRVRARVPQPIAHVKDADDVSIVGQAAVGEAEPVTAPVTGRQAVLFRVDVTARRYGAAGSGGGASGGGVFKVFSTGEGSDFIVDDGSGARARISVRDRYTAILSDLYVSGRHTRGLIKAHSETETLLANEAPQELRAWMEESGGPRRPRNERLRFEERLIEPGQTVFAQGPAAWRRGGDGEKELVLEGVDSDDGQLILSTYSRESLLRRTKRSSRLGYFFILPAIVGLFAGAFLDVPLWDFPDVPGILSRAFLDDTSGDSLDEVAIKYLRRGSASDLDAARRLVDPACLGRAEGRVEAVMRDGKPVDIDTVSVEHASEITSPITIRYKLIGKSGSVDKKGMLLMKQIEGRWLVSCSQ